MKTTISELLEKKDRDNDDKIFRFLHKEIQIKRRRHDLLMKRNEYSALQEALKCERSKEFILKIIEVWGRELAVVRCYNGMNALYYACYYIYCILCISMIISTSISMHEYFMHYI